MVVRQIRFKPLKEGELVRFSFGLLHNDSCDGSKVETPLMSESDCDKYFDTLKSKSIKMQTVYDKLLNDGLDSFKVSFRDLLSKLIN